MNTVKIIIGIMAVLFAAGSESEATPEWKQAADLFIAAESVIEYIAFYDIHGDGKNEVFTMFYGSRFGSVILTGYGFYYNNDVFSVKELARGTSHGTTLKRDMNTGEYYIFTSFHTGALVGEITIESLYNLHNSVNIQNEALNLEEITLDFHRIDDYADIYDLFKIYY